MKIQILDSTGKKSKEITTSIFDFKIREDIVQKVVESEKYWQEYAPGFDSGNKYSASGKIKHRRHVWKTHYGRGMSRIPRKSLSVRGNRYHWVGATIPGTKGGRRAHPPRIVERIRKINKKELKIAIRSALSMIANLDLVKSKYKRLEKKEIKQEFPIVIESKALEKKTKDFLIFLKKILGEFQIVGFQKKSIRAGKGKLRNRRYKQNAGLLLIIGNEEIKKVNSIEIKKVRDITVSDLVSNGARLIVFSETAIRDLEEKLEVVNKKLKTKVKEVIKK